jgi:hypothetical protein
MSNDRAFCRIETAVNISHVKITAADPAAVDADQKFTCSRLGDGDVADGKWLACTLENGCAHHRSYS